MNTPFEGKDYEPNLTRPHKFVAAQIGPPNYPGVIFCEYCGHIAFDVANLDIANDAAQDLAKMPCPRGRQPASRLST